MTLTKRIVVLHCLKRPELMINMSENSVEIVQFYGSPGSKETKLKRYYTVAEDDALKKTTYWTEQVQLIETNAEWKPQFIEMISKFKFMSNNHSWKISVAKHRIDLSPPNVPAIHATTYRAGPLQQQLKKEENEKLSRSSRLA